MWKHALLVEDIPAIAAAVQTVLRPSGWSVQHATDVGGALAWLERRRFCAAIVDLGLPDGSGLQVVRACAACQPRVPAVVLTVAAAWDGGAAALRAGASGYLLKEDAARLLPHAMDEAVRGGCPLSAPVARDVVVAALCAQEAVSAAPAPVVDGHDGLTARERDVLRWLSAGRSYQDIGDSLGVSANTVRTHVRSLYRKLGVHNRTLAVQAGARIGLIGPSG
ncbi:MAG: response regulator transcription factor [Deltaproteobacteria bacterium]|nr:response regulator transcription factor [Deltaproteobacteria bacterium]